MNQNPLVIIVVSVIALYLGKLWYDDYKKNCASQPQPQALPGATPVGLGVLLIAMAGALVILAVETMGEYLLDISKSQSTITALFFWGMIAASIIEEVIFRGFLVVDNKGRAALVGSVIGFSALFALGHFQYWIEWKKVEEGWLELNLNCQALWTLFILFLNSLWFYTVRFFSLNQNRSLLPCFAAHVSSNVGVFLIKLSQGHVKGFY